MGYGLLSYPLLLMDLPGQNYESDVFNLMFFLLWGSESSSPQFYQSGLISVTSQA